MQPQAPASRGGEPEPLGVAARQEDGRVLEDAGHRRLADVVDGAERPAFQGPPVPQDLQHLDQVAGELAGHEGELPALLPAVAEHGRIDAVGDDRDRQSGEGVRQVAPDVLRDAEHGERVVEVGEPGPDVGGIEEVERVVGVLVEDGDPGLEPAGLEPPAVELGHDDDVLGLDPAVEGVLTLRRQPDPRSGAGREPLQGVGDGPRPGAQPVPEPLEERRSQVRQVHR